MTLHLIIFYIIITSTKKYNILLFIILALGENTFINLESEIVIVYYLFPEFR